MAKRETKAAKAARERVEALEAQNEVEQENIRRIKREEQTLKDQLAAYRAAGVVKIETCSCCHKVYVRTKLSLIEAAEA